MNETNLTNILKTVDLNKGAEILSYLSKSLTGKVLDFLSSLGYHFSVRWGSLVVLFFSLLLLFLSMKISKPIIKYLLIIVALLILLGTIIPSW